VRLIPWYTPRSENLPETGNWDRMCRGSQILYCTFIEFCRFASLKTFVALHNVTFHVWDRLLPRREKNDYLLRRPNRVFLWLVIQWRKNHCVYPLARNTNHIPSQLISMTVVYTYNVHMRYIRQPVSVVILYHRLVWRRCARIVSAAFLLPFNSQPNRFSCRPL